MTAESLQDLDGARFRRDGFAVCRGFLNPERVRRLRAAVQADLAPLMGPVEYEADVGYPGAPRPGDAGADTPRRLLHAMSRDPVFRALACDPALGAILAELLATRDVRVSQCHHNCVMTKHPGYSSATAWHQDIRYWSFDRPELISVWAALGHEREHNGALALIPGSHQLDLERGQLDAELFLRPDLAANDRLIESAQTVELAPGDVLLFHCRTFHAAGMNRDQAVKCSAVFTYHAADNCPIPGTRSATYPSLPVLLSPPAGEPS